jgi:glycolate oxidase FAD binding subunit
MTDTITPTSFEGAAATLAGAAADGRPVRIIGGGTKLGWGAPGLPAGLELHTGALDRTLEHNVGDLTAIYEAGVPLERARAELAAEGQMLAIDAPLGAGGQTGATLGGMFATADCGPLRHRYGQPRDLIVGITVALSDGTIAKAGGKVIKNVAGYDLAKLFTGSFGTLGLILSVSVRLHPLPAATATALGAASDPDVLAAAAIALARAPVELEALDVAWRGGRGGLLAQSGGAEAERRSAGVAGRMRAGGLEGVDVTGEDDALWARQRAGQRSARLAVVRVAARPSELPAILRLTDACGGTLVGRAALGISYVEVDPTALTRLRAGLPPGASAVLLDAPPAQAATGRAPDDVWGTGDGRALDLMRRVKERFDPAAVCNPGTFVGGI